MTIDTVWWRSSHCGSGQCVEVARVAGSVLVRDGRRAPVLEFSPAAWREFVWAVSEMGDR